jgi:predicted nucleic acid-binding protein
VSNRAKDVGIALPSRSGAQHCRFAPETEPGFALKLDPGSDPHNQAVEQLQHACPGSRHDTSIRPNWLNIRCKSTVTDFIRRTSLVVEPMDPSNWPENDPDHQWIVATATIGDAQLLVSGDRDLLNASQEVPVEILNPREFWERLKYL